MPSLFYLAFLTSYRISGSFSNICLSAIASGRMFRNSDTDDL